MVNKNLITCLIVLAALPISSSAQRKKLHDVKGEWVVSNDITPMQARENAIQQAKVEALRLAGVPEVVTSTNLAFHSEQRKAMNDLFESLATVAISGEVSEFKIVKEDKKLNAYGNLVIDVWIDATVLLHQSARDPGFGMEVKGVHESYASPDKLVFDITPWKEGYLTAFILGENATLVLFPSTSESQEKLAAQNVAHFPRSNALDYEVSTENNLEINYLVLLYTKEEIPFLKEPTQENILKFIAGIEASQKTMKTFSFLIRKD